jgi:hypothetical protein
LSTTSVKAGVRLLAADLSATLADVVELYSDAPYVLLGGCGKPPGEATVGGVKRQARIFWYVSTSISQAVKRTWK